MAAEINQKAPHVHGGSYVAMAVMSHRKIEQYYKEVYE
jgi:hypothetical protein